MKDIYTDVILNSGNNRYGTSGLKFKEGWSDSGLECKGKKKSSFCSEKAKEVKRKVWKDMWLEV